MKEAFARDFQETLTKMKWPGKDVVLSGRLEIEWTEGVEKLLELQEPYVRPQTFEKLPCYQFYLWCSSSHMSCILYKGGPRPISIKHTPIPRT